MIKAGKRTLQWDRYRKKLKELFERNGIITCELKFPMCAHDDLLGFAHRHKRQWYYSTPGRDKLLGSPNQVLLACNICHSKIEYDPELTEAMFKMKRPIKLN
jgi:hypothetical protein